MGNYRIVIDAVGGHGCQRDVGDGGHVVGCRQMGCPDCEAREFVARLGRQGSTVQKARLTHWPADLTGQPDSEVRDDLLTGTRSGSF